ncbi:MAG: SlyX family protein [Deltaproteobacteria bacterium]|jgi:uncharacterized coiled-coil protein SlyX|nr:SlyX family protein [Deltaproteobacteria bacterium]MBT6433952.1 SlyX family protein [Deltaproteobacteria bacterium]MBT6491165.1 SlyX family protein [Deltaproteobacteria bacterium]
MDQRIMKLEETVAFQDAIISKLNDTVAEQGLLLHRLESQLKTLDAHVRQAMPSMTVEAKDDVPPPHY